MALQGQATRALQPCLPLPLPAARPPSSNVTATSPWCRMGTPVICESTRWYPQSVSASSLSSLPGGTRPGSAGQWLLSEPSVRGNGRNGTGAVSCTNTIPFCSGRAGAVGKHDFCRPSRTGGNSTLWCSRSSDTGGAGCPARQQGTQHHPSPCCFQREQGPRHQILRPLLSPEALKDPGKWPVSVHLVE